MLLSFKQKIGPNNKWILLLALTACFISSAIFLKLDKNQSGLEKKLDDNADNLSDQVSYQLEVANKNQLLAINQQLTRLQNDLSQQLTDLREVLHQISVITILIFYTKKH